MGICRHLYLYLYINRYTHVFIYIYTYGAQKNFTQVPISMLPDVVEANVGSKIAKKTLCKETVLGKKNYSLEN